MFSKISNNIHSYQDRYDDLKAGVGSTAVLFGSIIRTILSGFAVVFISLLAFSGYMNGQGVAYYLFAVGAATAHMTWQLMTVNFNDKSDCMAKFIVSNQRDNPKASYDLRVPFCSLTVRWDITSGPGCSSIISRRYIPLCDVYSRETVVRR